jgi:hypothetical protein
MGRHPARLAPDAATAGCCWPQAAEAERQEDREIICEEVFIDITGQVDAAARGT